tara:strand:+ start:504 stop:812 length:309 start_codon:yes stop_codon:yes gene_type:complete
MISQVTFIAVSIITVFVIKKLSQQRSQGVIFFLKYLIMLTAGGQFYSIFLYGGDIKGAPVSILFFENAIVNSLSLPGNIQFVALPTFLYLAFFCHPKHKKRA